MKTIIKELNYLKKKFIVYHNAWKKILLSLANIFIKNVPDPCNAKENYESFLRKKNRKSVKQWEIITYKPKAFYTVNINSKTLYKFPNTIRRNKKPANFLKDKNVKTTRRAHVFKGYASSYNVEVWISSNPEQQLKDTESVIKSKLIELLFQLRSFKFVATLDLVFKKIESKDKTNYGNFYSSS